MNRQEDSELTSNRLSVGRNVNRCDTHVNHSDVASPVDREPRVDNTVVFPGKHSGGANGVVLGPDDASDPGLELSIGLNVESRLSFRLDVLSEGGLRSDFANELSRFREEEEIEGRLKVGRVDQRRRERFGRFDVLNSE